MTQKFITTNLPLLLQKSSIVNLLFFLILSGIQIDSAKAIPISYQTYAAVLDNTISAPQNNPASKSDSNRLTKKIVPVIQKSFSRYPPYYLFIFIGGFILFALIRLIDPSYLNSVFVAAGNINLLLNLFKEGIFGFNITGLLLDLVCIGMMGIYVQVFFYTS